MATEGYLTEKQYVQGLNAHLQSQGIATYVKTLGVGKDPLKVVQSCIAKRAELESKSYPFDACFCLIDVDQQRSIEQAVKLAKSHEIQLIISNLKFEVWLRWHAEDKTSQLSSLTLDQRVTALNLCVNKHLSPSFPFDGVDQAYAIAHRVDPNLAPGRLGPDPSTAMPILIDYMRGQAN